MGTYKIIWKHSAKKELRRLSKKTIGNILSAIEKLPDDQHLISSKKLIGTEHTYRLRIGDYRVVYSIERIFWLLKSFEWGIEKMFIEESHKRISLQEDAREYYVAGG